MGLYRLMVEDYDNRNSEHLPVFENSKLNKKVDIQSIDLYLSTDYLIGFKDKYELIDHWNKLGRDFSNAVDIEILYENDGQTKKVPVVFGSYAPLTYFAQRFVRLKQKSVKIKNKTKEDRQAILDEIRADKNWVNLVDKFYTAIKDGNFVAFADPKIDDLRPDFVKYLNYKLTDRMMNLIYDYLKNCKKNTHEAIEASNIAQYGIELALTNYRVLRDVILVMREYDLHYKTSYGLNEEEMKLELNRIKKTDSPNADIDIMIEYGAYSQEHKKNYEMVHDIEMPEKNYEIVHDIEIPEKKVLDNMDQDILATYSTEDINELFKNEAADIYSMEDKLYTKR